MSDAPPVLHDPARLAALRASALLDTPAEPSFDRLTRLAVRLLDVPVALVTLVDAERQFFKSLVGLPEPWATRRHTPLTHSFCQHVVADGSPLVVEDARAHPLVCHNLAIPDLGVVAYAGVPLTTRGGQVLGAFCAIDGQPRRWTAAELETLADLAASVSAEIELRTELAARHRAEAELQRRSAYLRALAESSSDLVCVLDGGSHLRYLSPAVQRVLGYAPRGRRETDLLEWLHPDDAPAAVEALTGLLREPGGSRLFEVRVRHADGSYRVLEALGRNLLHDPAVAGVVVNSRDVTARRRAEAALLASQARLRRIAANVPGIVYQFALDPAGGVSFPYVSEGSRGVAGLAPGEMQGHPAATLDRIHPQDRPDFDARVAASAATLEPWHWQGRIVTPEGETRWVQGAARPERHPDGTTVWDGVLLDVSQLQHAEAELQASREHYRVLFETAPVGIVSVDAEGRFLQTNPAFCAMLGCTPEELGGTPFRALAHPDEADRLAGLWAELRDGGREGYQVEKRYRHRDGRTLWTSLTARAVRDAAGRLQYAVALVEDITERKRAQDVLRAAHDELEDRVRARTSELDRATEWLWRSEEHFRALIENASDITAVIDQDTRIRYESPSIVRVLGYEPHELLGRTFGEFIHPDDLPAVMERFRAVLGGAERTVALEARIRNRAGEWRLLEIAAKNLLRVEAVRGVVVNARDVTYRAQIEEALRQSERDYRGLFENAHDAILILDPESEEVLEVNARACDLYGIPRERFVGLSLLGLSRDAEQGRRHIRETMGRGDAAHHFETTQFRADGREMSLEVRASVVEYRRRRAILSINRDITDRKRVETALRESEERFRQLAENIREVFYMNERGTGRMLYVSPGYEEIWGRSCQSLYREPASWRLALHPDDAERVTAQMAAAGDAPCQVEYRVVRPDGAVRWIRDRSFPVHDAEGAVYRHAGIAADITESRRLESELRQAQKMEAVGRLAGGIAHDFNNLLMSIMAHTYVLLRDGGANEAVRDGAEEIQRSSERAAALTRQLLAFSRKQVLQPTVLELREVVEGTGAMLRRLIGEHVELGITPDPAPGRVRADRTQLEQVLMNLVVNARDAMPEGGRVTVRTHTVHLPRPQERDGAAVPAGSYAVLAVSDTGQGMDRQTRARVFEPFFTTKELGKGTGLGLSTVYGIVKQSGGWIWADSEPGRGTVFEIYLPLVEQPAAAPAPAPRGGAPGRGCETLLLVEDDEAVRAPLRRVLEESGYRVLEAADGREGLDAARGAPVDLVLCDVVMPRMGGPELARHLRGARPGLPVLFMSGHTDEAVARHGELEDGAGFLQKPVSPDEVVRRVREVLDGKGRA